MSRHESGRGGYRGGYREVVENPTVKELKSQLEWMEKKDVRYENIYDTRMVECMYWKNAAKISENNVKIVMTEDDELKERPER